MRLAKQEIPQVPTLPKDDVLRLRASLILEEALETIDALGCQVLLDRHIDVNKKNVSIVSVKEANLEEICDGIADISVVSIGTLSACGVSDQGLLKMVDENNLAKFGEGHSFRADGKLIKSPLHKKPDITGYLKTQSPKKDK